MSCSKLFPLKKNWMQKRRSKCGPCIDRILCLFLGQLQLFEHSESEKARGIKAGNVEPFAIDHGGLGVATDQAAVGFRVGPGILIIQAPAQRFPHRKILEYLAQQYDYGEKAYVEVNMSRIVKECRLGKNRAKEYLDCLESKGLLVKREDGYRVWYRIAK